MQITVESLMDGEHLPLNIGNIRVFLDGQEVRKVVALDTEEGWVEKHVEPLTLDPIEEDEFLTEKLYGEVVVERAR